MAPRRRCPVCRSKQWHKEPSSGLIACSEGHILQSYINEVAETDEMGPHALRKRTLKFGRKKKERASKADPKLYHGTRAQYHYFQCLQLLLRKQIVSLIGLWSLPSEFEIICKDIWALHLSLLPTPPPPEPFLYSQETTNANSDTDQTAMPDAPTEDKDKDESEEFSSESPSDSEEEYDEEDPELAELLRENSISGSESDDDDESDPVDPATKSTRTRTQKIKKKKATERYDLPASNIAVLMLTCWTMRIPVMYADFRKIIESYQLPYLDSVRLLPHTLTLHLTKYVTQMLSPHHAPSTLFLHSLSSRLAKLMYSKYGILTPELNAAPILWRAVHCLGGTPTLYKLTKRLAHILSFPLTLHHSLAPALKSRGKRDPDRHKFDSVPPELAFSVTCIVVLKMVYGLDGKKRLPKFSNDPACALPRWNEYVEFIKALDDEDLKTKDVVFSSEKYMSVGDLSEPMIDDYLTFCERALLKPEDKQTSERSLLGDHFPVERRNSVNEAVPTAIKEASLRHKRRANLFQGDDENVMRPGESYIIYNATDVFGTPAEEYELVIRRAARWVGVTENFLGQVIENYERRIVRWWNAEQKKQRSG